MDRTKIIPKKLRQEVVQEPPVLKQLCSFEIPKESGSIEVAPSH